MKIILNTLFILTLLLGVCQANAATNIYYVHNDHLGTPKAMTDANQTVVWKSEHTPFGNSTVDEDPDGDSINVVMNVRFPGQYYDQETNLHYNWNRYYDPNIGRYITSDPIGLTGGVNTYGYALQNPIMYYDPLGKAIIAINPATLAAAEKAIAVVLGILGLGAAIENATDETKDKSKCKFIREVYYEGNCKQCWYSCPDYNGPVVYRQKVGKTCPSVGANGLVNTSEIDPECLPGEKNCKE